MCLSSVLKASIMAPIATLPPQPTLPFTVLASATGPTLNPSRRVPLLDAQIASG